MLKLKCQGGDTIKVRRGLTYAIIISIEHGNRKQVAYLTKSEVRLLANELAKG